VGVNAVAREPTMLRGIEELVQTIAQSRTALRSSPGTASWPPISGDEAVDGIFGVVLSGRWAHKGGLMDGGADAA